MIIPVLLILVLAIHSWHTCVIVTAVSGNIIEPAIFGQHLELHPVTVLLALAFWYLVWGSAGAILSVPITAIIRIVMLHLQERSPYARASVALLEGRLSEVFVGL